MASIRSIAGKGQGESQMVRFCSADSPIINLDLYFGLSLFTSDYKPAIVSSDDPSGLLFLGMVGGLFIGFFEELGWTAFATPRLTQLFNIITTGMIVGMLWGA